MSDIPQVERQLYILSLLSNNRRGFTLEEITNSLQRIGIDVSRKTVERDIDSITTGFFVYEDLRDGKTVYLANKYSLQHVSFTISEMISLYFTREVMKSYSALDIGASAVKILDRLIESAPKVDRSFIETLSEMMKINVSDITIEKELNPEHLEIIREAIGDCRRLLVGYHSFNSNEETTRGFDPYLLEIYEGCWHVVGYCHLRHAIRDLRVSRITSLEMLQDIFQRPENFYESYNSKRFDKLAGEEKIELVIRFKGRAARYVKEYEGDKAHSIRDEEGGSILFRRSATMTPEIKKWVLSFGADAQVLEPESLRKEIMEEAERMRELYGHML